MRAESANVLFGGVVNFPRRWAGGMRPATSVYVQACLAEAGW